MRRCRNINIRPVFKSSRTLRSLLTKVKKRIPQERVKGVIYRVQCECGSTYVGETGRTLETRLKEHKRAVRYDDQNNGIAVHANNTCHTIQWGDAEVLDKEQNWSKRKLKEALHIREEKDPMNLDQGRLLNTIWSTLKS